MGLRGHLTRPGHAAVLGLVAHIEIQLFLLILPRLPFSQPPRVGATGGSVVGTGLLAGIFVGLLALIVNVAYVEPARTIAAMALLAGVSVVLPAVVARSIRPRVRKLEFSG